MFLKDQGEQHCFTVHEVGRVGLWNWRGRPLQRPLALPIIRERGTGDEPARADWYQEEMDSA